MKNLLFLFSFFISGVANATDYYFSTSTGDDNRTSLQAQNASTPWKSISKLNSFFSSLNAGDKIYFKRGEIFYGGITVNKSGTSASPITIGAYGTGEDPVITGFYTVPLWTNTGTNIWESAAAVSTLSSSNIISVNGVNVAMGRMPKTGFWTIGSTNGNSITDATNLNSSSKNWTGAQVVLRKYRWIMDKFNITAASGSTVSFANSGDAIQTGWGYFIQNDIKTLTQQNDWCFNSTTKKISIYSTSTPVNVQVPSIEVGANLNNNNYITFDNISFTGFNSTGIHTSSKTGIVIQNGAFNFIGTDAIYAYPNSPNLKVTGNTFNEINSRGIHGGSSSNAFINNNTLLNTGNLPGMGSNGADSYTAIISNGDNAEVSYNSITNAGYVGIRWDGNAAVIKNNFVNTTNYIKDDGGGIYCYPNQLGAVAQSYIQRTVSNNIVINSIGAIAGGTPSSGSSEAMGIYNDGASPNVTYTNNTISNAHLGLYFNGGHEITSSGNTIYNCSRGYYIVNSIASIGIANNTVTNNIFVARDANQYAAYFEPGSSSMPSSFTANNNIYARPIDDNVTIWRDANGTNYYNTLAQWRSYSGQDAASGKSPVNINNINDLRLVYNETATSKTISLGANYIDMKSVSYPGSITLAPYTSAVLVKTGAGNATPTANAGTDKTITLPTATVSLTGSGTDADGTIVSYLWTKISGPTAGTIISAASASTSVSSLVQGVYKFELKVTDNAAATGRDTIQVTVNAVAGASNAYGGTAWPIPGTIQVEDFDNGGPNVAYYDSSPENLGGAYRLTESIDLQIATEAGANIGWSEPGEWTKYSVNVMTAGIYSLQARLSSQNATSSFRVEMDGVTIATITVPNTGGYQTWQTVTIPNINLSAGLKMMRIYFITGGFNINYLAFTGSVNLNPAANAGADKSIALPTAAVNLAGSGTDADGTIASYAWTKISGPAGAVITSATNASTSVTALVQGIYKFELKVTDNATAVGRDTMQVIVNAAGNIVPTANAGSDKTIVLPISVISLLGTGTDSDGTIASYKWLKITGSNTAIITSSTSAATTVTGLTEGTYDFELTVTDNSGATAKDNVQVIVSAAYTVGEKIINVNIYGGTNPLADTKWNNWKSVSKSVSSNFKYEDGTQSKVNAVLSAQQKIGNNGTGYASSATSCPPAVLQYYSTNSAQRSLTIKGLSASGQYTFRFYASSSVVSNGTTFLIGTVSDDIMTDNNVNNVAQIVNVKPDANGTVVVKLLSINTYNYIAGFTIIEQSGQVAGRSVQSVVEEEAALPALKTIIEETKVSVSIFPNPFTTLVKIQLNGGPAGVYQLSLIDISGRPIWKKALNKAGGAITEPVNTSNLPGGVYILQVISPDKIQSSIKIMKLN